MVWIGRRIWIDWNTVFETSCLKHPLSISCFRGEEVTIERRSDREREREREPEITAICKKTRKSDGKQVTEIETTDSRDKVRKFRTLALYYSAVLIKMKRMTCNKQNERRDQAKKERAKQKADISLSFQRHPHETKQESSEGLYFSRVLGSSKSKAWHPINTTNEDTNHDLARQTSPVKVGCAARQQSQNG